MKVSDSGSTSEDKSNSGENVFELHETAARLVTLRLISPENNKMARFFNFFKSNYNKNDNVNNATNNSNINSNMKWSYNAPVGPTIQVAEESVDDFATALASGLSPDEAVRALIISEELTQLAATVTNGDQTAALRVLLDRLRPREIQQEASKAAVSAASSAHVVVSSVAPIDAIVTTTQTPLESLPRPAPPVSSLNLLHSTEATTTSTTTTTTPAAISSTALDAISTATSLPTATAQVHTPTQSASLVLGSKMPKMPTNVNKTALTDKPKSKVLLNRHSQPQSLTAAIFAAAASPTRSRSRSPSPDSKSAKSNTSASRHRPKRETKTVVDAKTSLSTHALQASERRPKRARKR